MKSHVVRLRKEINGKKLLASDDQMHTYIDPWHIIEAAMLFQSLQCDCYVFFL